MTTFTISKDSYTKDMKHCVLPFVSIHNNMKKTTHYIKLQEDEYLKKEDEHEDEDEPDTQFPMEDIDEYSEDTWWDTVWNEMDSDCEEKLIWKFNQVN